MTCRFRSYNPNDAVLQNAVHISGFFAIRQSYYETWRSNVPNGGIVINTLEFAKRVELTRTHRKAVVGRLQEISQALTEAHWRQDFESRWAAELLVEALQSNLAELSALER